MLIILVLLIIMNADKGLDRTCKNHKKDMSFKNSIVDKVISINNKKLKMIIMNIKPLVRGNLPSHKIT